MPTNYQPAIEKSQKILYEQCVKRALRIGIGIEETIVNDILKRLHPQFRGVACRIAETMDDNLIDDLVQEMAGAILLCKQGQTDAFYLRRAADRARNYLKRERRQLPNFTDLGLDEFGNSPDKGSDTH